MTAKPPAEVKAFLDRVRKAEGPSPDRRERIHRAMQGRLSQLGLQDVGSPTATPAGPASGASLFAKSQASRLVLVVAVAAVGGGVAVWQASEQPASTGDGRQVVDRQASAPSQPTTTPSAPGAADAPSERASAEAGTGRPTPDPAPSSPTAMAVVARRGDEGPRGGGVRGIVPSGPRRVSVEVARHPTPASHTGPGARGSTHAEPARRARPSGIFQARVSTPPPRPASGGPAASVAEGPSQAPTSEAAEASGLAEELALIRAARDGLRLDDRAAARRAVAEHASRFPDGVLAEERRGLHLLLMCQTHAPDAIKAQRDRFLRRSPDSVLAAQVRRACGPLDSE